MSVARLVNVRQPAVVWHRARKLASQPPIHRRSSTASVRH